MTKISKLDGKIRLRTGCKVSYCQFLTELLAGTFYNCVYACNILGMGPDIRHFLSLSIV